LSAAYKYELAEFTVLGASIRKIAQRYSSRHPGSKTRVLASLDLEESEIRDFENEEILSYKAKLQEVLGNHVDFELILIILESFVDWESPVKLQASSTPRRATYYGRWDDRGSIPRE